VTTANRQSPTQNETTATGVWLRRFLIVLTTLGSIIIAGIIISLIEKIGTTLLIFAISIVLAYAIFPLVRFLRQFLPKTVAVLIAYVGVFTLLLLFLYLVGLTAIGQLIRLATALQHTLPQLLALLQPSFKTLESLGISASSIQNAGTQIVNYLLQFASNLQPFILGLFGIFITMILITTLSVYFVVYGPRAVSWLKTRTPLKHRDTIVFFLQTVDQTMGGFIRGQILLGAIMSIIMAIGLLVLGVPYVVLLALVVFVFEFVPQIGAYISGIIVTLIVFLTRGWEIGLIYIVYSSLMQGIVDGQILAPRIIGHSVGLNPIISILALLIGAELFGLAGAFFAAPIAGALQVFIIVSYYSWKRNHPDQFPEQQENAETTTEHT
jgi:predicted PurR-regulated permease PerM